MEVTQTSAVVPASEAAATSPTSQVWVFGSGECDQLGLEFGDDDVMEIKRAKKIELFNNDGSSVEGIPASITEKLPVSLVMCGGVHSAVLTSTGLAYTWGCNDDGALGRTGTDSVPGRVNLPQTVNGLALGGSHTIFYNTELSNAFFCGLYRNAVQGKVGDSVKEPQEFGQAYFKKGKRQLTKIVSGLDHSVALTTDGKVGAWGDPESGKIGRMLKSRGRHNQSRKIEQVGAKKAVDVWCAGHASFYRNDKGQLFGWGLNNHGQLGVGHKENICAPQRVYWVEGEEEATCVSGGEHHTIALTKSGRVYCWGRNDEGECGVGDLFGKYRREKAILDQQQAEEAERKAKEDAEKAASIVQEAEPAGEAGAQEGAMTTSQATKKTRKSSKKSKEEQEPDLAGIYYFAVPNPVASLDGKGITSVEARGHYCYALAQESNEVYAWGMGDNYVLGTRDDENEYEPKLVHPKQFMENRVRQVACGVQHVVVLTTAAKEPESNIPRIDQSVLSTKFEMPKEEAKAEEVPSKEEETKANGVLQAEKEESKDKVEAPVVEEKPATQEEKKVESSQQLSQASKSSKKRTAADLKARQEALEPATETIPEEDDKRSKGE